VLWNILALILAAIGISGKLSVRAADGLLISAWVVAMPGIFRWPVVNSFSMTPRILSTMLVASILGLTLYGISYWYSQPNEAQVAKESASANGPSSELTGSPDKPAKPAFIEGVGPTWLIKDENNRLEVVGRFLNSGDIDTEAVVTNQVLVNGKDVTEAGEAGPDRLQFSVRDRRRWTGPIFYLKNMAYEAAHKYPESLEIHSLFIYPDGHGGTLQLEHWMGFVPGLKVRVLRHDTNPKH
jgi:hypothetical protein